MKKKKKNKSFRKKLCYNILMIRKEMKVNEKIRVI